MIEVNEWLRSKTKDYSTGVKIFLRHNNDPALRDLFTLEEETDFKRKRLEKAMTELISPPISPVKNDQGKVRPPVKELPTGWPNPLDEVLKALHTQWKEKYALIMNLQQRIFEVALQAENGDPAKKLEACQMALQILELEEQVDQFYEQRDYYLEHNRLPEKVQEKEIIGDPVRWATELQNAQRYVREYKGKIAKDPANKRAAKWAQKLKDYQADVKHYKKLLKLE